MEGFELTRHTPPNAPLSPRPLSHVRRCSLADTIRVGDDFGKFALQYRMFEDPLIGMHGSFVVCQNAVEIDFGFDHGLEGSITEDTFFAMHIAAHGVHVKWCIRAPDFIHELIWCSTLPHLYSTRGFNVVGPHNPDTSVGSKMQGHLRNCLRM